jgi:hypothetical protein
MRLVAVDRNRAMTVAASVRPGAAIAEIVGTAEIAGTAGGAAVASEAAVTESAVAGIGLAGEMMRTAARGGTGPHLEAKAARSLP